MKALIFGNGALHLHVYDQQKKIVQKEVVDNLMQNTRMFWIKHFFIKV